MIEKKIIAIDPVNPELRIIKKAGKMIQNNGLVIFPTTCLYGMAANALNEEAVKKIFLSKQRPLNKAILLLIKDRAMLLDLVTSIPDSACKLMDVFWPGNLTLIFEARDHVSKLLTAGTGKIGIRLPAHPVAKALVEAAGFPITGTSANLSGREGCSQVSRLDSPVIDQADIVLDAGTLKGGKGSTIADVTSPRINILREGEVTMGQINEIIAI